MRLWTVGTFSVGHIIWGNTMGEGTFVQGVGGKAREREREREEGIRNSEGDGRNETKRVVVVVVVRSDTILYLEEGREGGTRSAWAGRMRAARPPSGLFK